MRRYWLNDQLKIGQSFKIGDDLFKHIHIVCRQKLGDQFELIGPEGKLFLSEIIDLQKNFLMVKVLSSREISKIKKPYLRLFISLPKIKTLEAVVEKSVELGVYSLEPFYSDFSFFKSKDKIEDKAKRLKKIVLAACQQSARFEELKISETKSFSEVLKYYSSEKTKSKKIEALAFYEGRGQLLSEFFFEKLSQQSVQKELSGLRHSVVSEDLPDELWVFVGSEGGFSVKEIQRFQELNIPSLSLGEQILRVETACVSIMSILKYVYSLF